MFDPSKMDPKLLMELSSLIQQLPPDQLGRMQTMMHNMMAGFDVSKEMEAFERTLPPGFREKLLAVMGPQATAMEVTPEAVTAPDMDLRGARLTLLQAVSEGKLPPEDAERLLFPGG